VYLLANNRDVQQRLFAEITGVMRGRHQPITSAAAAAAATATGDVSQFKYLNCVVKEALR